MFFGARAIPYSFLYQYRGFEPRYLMRKRTQEELKFWGHTRRLRSDSFKVERMPSNRFKASEALGRFSGSSHVILFPNSRKDSRPLYFYDKWNEHCHEQALGDSPEILWQWHCQADICPVWMGRKELYERTLALSYLVRKFHCPLYLWAQEDIDTRDRNQWSSIARVGWTSDRAIQTSK